MIDQWHLRAATADRWEQSESLPAFPRVASPCPSASVPTEITECKDRQPPSGWIFYDGECAICTGLAARFGKPLLRAGFALVAFQNPWAAAKLGLQPGEIPNAARVVTPCGESFDGADAMLILARRFGWARPLAWMGRWHPAMLAMRRAYAWFAARRHCIGGVCNLPTPAATTTGLAPRREAK